MIVAGLEAEEVVVDRCGAQNVFDVHFVFGTIDGARAIRGPGHNLGVEKTSAFVMHCRYRIHERIS